MAPIKIKNPKIIRGTGAALRNVAIEHRTTLGALVISAVIGVSAMITNMSVDANSNSEQFLISHFMKPYDFINDDRLCQFRSASIPFQVEFNNDHDAYARAGADFLFRLRTGSPTISIDKSLSMVNFRAVAGNEALWDMAEKIIDNHEIPVGQDYSGKIFHNIFETYMTDAASRRYEVDQLTLQKQMQCFVLHHEVTHAYIFESDLNKSKEYLPLLEIYGRSTNRVYHEYIADHIGLRKTLFDIAASTSNDEEFTKQVSAFVDIVTLFRSHNKRGDTHIGGTLAISDFIQENDKNPLRRESALEQFTDENLVKEMNNLLSKWDITTEPNKDFYLATTSEDVESEYGKIFLERTETSSEFLNKKADQISHWINDAFKTQTQNIAQCTTFDRSIKSSIACFRDKQAESTPQQEANLKL